MLPASPVKSDLVSGMTVAEIFLLLVFIVWCGAVTLSKGSHDPDYWKTIAEQSQKKNEELKSQIELLTAEKEKRAKEVAFWQKVFGLSQPPTSLEELTSALRSTPAGREVLHEAGRGYPRCEEKNLLVSAALQKGDITMQVVANSRRLEEWSHDSGVRIEPMGSVLKDWSTIHKFLGKLGEFYAAQPGARSCRFDYRLTYETNDDYHDGREIFEGSFYAANVTRIGGRATGP
jgi:hypothetical protein